MSGGRETRTETRKEKGGVDVLAAWSHIKRQPHGMWSHPSPEEEAGAMLEQEGLQGAHAILSRRADEERVSAPWLGDRGYWTKTLLVLEDSKQSRLACPNCGAPRTVSKGADSERFVSGARECRRCGATYGGTLLRVGLMRQANGERGTRGE